VNFRSRQNNTWSSTSAPITRRRAFRRKKSKEALARFLSESGVDYKREHHVDYICTEVQEDHFARVDFLMVRQRTLVLLENDEQQHDWIPTSCDVKRMAEIVETLAVGGNELPVAFIRFNPHAFRRDRVLHKLPQTERRERLLRILRDPSHPVYDKGQPLKILHMYYNTLQGNPLALEDYGALRKCVMPCVKD
jgi:hypothetical protein